MVSVVAKDYRSKPGEYGETKKQKQFLLTPTASEMLDNLAESYGATRSDFLERIIRGLHNWNEEERDQLLLEIGAIEEESES